MSRRGSAVLTAYQARLEADRLAQHVTQRCAWCPDWHTTGTLAETRETARAHRLERHPEARERKHKQRPGQLTTGKRPVGANIENARSQGAAGWAS